MVARCILQHMRSEEDIRRQLRSLRASRKINDGEPIDDGDGLCVGMSKNLKDALDSMINDGEECLLWVLGESDVPLERQMTDEELKMWEV